MTRSSGVEVMGFTSYQVVITAPLTVSFSLKLFSLVASNHNAISLAFVITGEFLLNDLADESFAALIILDPLVIPITKIPIIKITTES